MSCFKFNGFKFNGKDASAFGRKVREEEDAFLASWMAFLSLHKSEKIPYPELYKTAFSEALRVDDKKNELVEILLKGKDIFGAFLKKLTPKVIREFNLEEEVNSLQEYVTHLKKLEAELNSLRETCLRDDLTGLWNRKGLRRFFSEVVIPNIFEQDYILVYFDIDKFKQINDRYGHQVGDMAIIAMSKFLQETFKPKDFVSRLYGDEFAVIAVGTTLDKIVPFLSELHEKGFCFSFKESVLNRVVELKLKFSIGATNIIASDTIESVLERADSAMYECKRTGKVGCIRV